jgi:beta-phosphoglucomutase
VGIASLFDAVIDGAKIQQAKPDPEVFLVAAQELGMPPASCVVFEDAEAGIEAAHRAGMGAVGIGEPAVLMDADVVVQGLDQLIALMPS